MIADLSDARRAVKWWLPADDRDVTGGLVVADTAGKPSCVWHGAMNRVHPVDMVYRCSEFQCGVGAQVVSAPVIVLQSQPCPN
ncbi:MAG: hypothetical protein ACRDTZ_07320 [Pseudonocardiaceae bacterium]